jgi:hypothetical protein
MSTYAKMDKEVWYTINPQKGRKSGHLQQHGKT